MNIKLLTFLLLICINFSYAQEKHNVYDVARKGTIEQAKDYLNNNPDAFNVVNDDGYSPLTLACYRGNNEVAKLLIETKSDINGISKMGTPLMACIFKGNNEISKLLIEKKAKLDVADPNGTTALIYAVNSRNYEIVSALVKANANIELIDSQKKSALDYAIMLDDDKLIELLKNKNKKL